MRKILFLDIDGVLNPRWWENKFDKTPIDQFGYAFDAKCVAYLAKIIKETKADIVISSSWKCWGLPALKEMWRNRKLPGQVVDITPDIMSDEVLLNAELSSADQLYTRGCEIKGWLLQHKDEDVRYVIIDDMDNYLSEQQSRFVQTDPEIGLSETDAVKVKLLFKQQSTY